MNKIKFQGNLVTGESDLNTAQIICIPSKPRYEEVDLCLRDNEHSPSVHVGRIKSSYLPFEESIKIGTEIENRWIGYANKQIEINILKGFIDSNDIDFEDILKLINSELIDREKLHKQTRKDKKTIESLERQILGLRQIVGGVP